MFEIILKNKDWIFSGIGIFILTGILFLIKRWAKGSTIDDKPIQTTTNNNNLTNTNNNNLTNHIHLPPNEYQAASDLKPKIDEQVDYFKLHKKILFIDDEREFKIISTLKGAGWKCVEIIGDPKSIDDEKIRNADFLFVDVQGVGIKMGFSEQGLGLTKAIRERYPSKKIVVYSAVKGWDPFSEGFRIADDQLKKNAEFYEFESIIIRLLKS